MLAHDIRVGEILISVSDIEVAVPAQPAPGCGLRDIDRAVIETTCDAGHTSTAATERMRSADSVAAPMRRVVLGDGAPEPIATSAEHGRRLPGRTPRGASPWP